MITNLKVRGFDWSQPIETNSGHPLHYVGVNKDGYPVVQYDMPRHPDNGDYFWINEHFHVRRGCEMLVQQWRVRPRRPKLPEPPNPIIERLNSIQAAVTEGLRDAARINLDLCQKYGIEPPERVKELASGEK